MILRLPFVIIALIFMFLLSLLAAENLVNIGQEPLNVKSASSTDQPRLGIVSTWRGHSETWANSWIRYHIGIGFSRIYLFFDDPDYDKNLIELLSKTAEYKYFLTIIKVDKEHRKKFWTPDKKKSLDPEQWLLPAFGVYLETCHTSRQIMNVARAGVMARADDLDWLVHIDADELVWIERLKSGCARNFFRQLSNQGITHAILFNDEIVPLTPDYDFKKRPKDPFHQRMHFKRNLLTFSTWKQNDLVQKWASDRGVQFFIGYMCGKGAINVRLWEKNFGEKSPVLPQDVVAFAYDSWQPGNITIINENTNVIQPYISSKKVKVSVLTNKARILHYVNADFESMKKKLKGRKKFNLNNYDISNVNSKRKELFKAWQRNWARTESIPNSQYYEKIWSLFSKSSKTNDFRNVLEFYIKAAVIPKGKKLDEMIKHGVIYSTREVVQFMNQIEKLLDKKKGVDKTQLMVDLSNGFKFIHGGKGNKDNEETFQLHGCKSKAPHFFCEIQECCDFTTRAQFTFTKRLLGYKRYDKLQWWKPGIKWPQ